MELRLVIGDILTPIKGEDHPPTIVCHQVNCKGVMGGGLAKQVREKFPGVYDVYKQRCDAGFAELGQVQMCSVLAEAGYLIANIFGQRDYGTDKRYTDYQALKEAFTYIADRYAGYTIRIPNRIGCGLGGGSWQIVSKILHDVFEATDAVVELWAMPPKEIE